MVGASVVGAKVVGAGVGAKVVGARVVGGRVVGANVVGLSVVGANVVGASVVGAIVVATAVVRVRTGYHSPLASLKNCPLVSDCQMLNYLLQFMLLFRCRFLVDKQIQEKLYQLY